MGRRWKGPTIEWSYAWEETNNILPRSWRFILLYWKWSHVWHIGFGEKLFHHQVSIVWRHWYSRSQISHEPSDILSTCTWVFRGLDGSTCSESLPERMRHFEPPEHVPRSSARAQTCVRGPDGLPAWHGAESTRKDPRPEEKKMPKSQKNTFYPTW